MAAFHASFRFLFRTQVEESHSSAAFMKAGPAAFVSLSSRMIFIALTGLRTPWECWPCAGAAKRGRRAVALAKLCFEARLVGAGCC